MATNEQDEEVRTPKDLSNALQDSPEAAAIWEALPATHRRGHVIAIERLEDPKARAERVEHTIEHLLEKHTS